VRKVGITLRLRMRGPEACELATRSNGTIIAALSRVGNADELGRSEPRP
jgi:hypothetical protein